MTILALFFLPMFTGSGVAQMLDKASSNKLYETVGHLYGVDPVLLAAIAQVESGNDARAISPKGAQGLMQLMPSTAREFGVGDPFDPVENVLGAARFLLFLQMSLSMHETAAPALPAILAAYNAGPGAVRRYSGIPPYDDTREYVRTVLTIFFAHDKGKPTPANVPPATVKIATPKRSAVRKNQAARSDSRWLSQLEDLRRERDSQALGN